MYSPTRTHSSKTEQPSRDAKLLREIDEETTKLLSPHFNDAVWLDRAHLLLKGLNMPLNEARFKSSVLVLNGRIKQYLRLSLDVGSLNPAKVFRHIIEFDSLINEGMKLPRTPSLDHFQLYAKSLLFRSVGDTFLLLHNEKGSTAYEELSYISYVVAFDILHKASSISPLLAALFILETLTLRTLLQYFSATNLSRANSQQVGERLYKACNGVTTLRSKSFMVSISSVSYSYEVHSMEQNEIARMLILADKDDFLINLLWLLAYSMDVRNNAVFLDPFIKNIPSWTCGDDLQSFTETSLTKIDVKVLLLSAAQWLKLNTYYGQKRVAIKSGILPALAFTQPSYMMRRFWSLVVTFANNEMCHSSHHCFENGLIISALEASRLRGEVPDLRIVDSVRKWLIANGNALGDTRGNWAKLYSRVFMDFMNGAHYANQAVLIEDSFFPPVNDSLSVRSEYDMLEDAEIWLSRQNSSASQSKTKSNCFSEEFLLLKQPDTLEGEIEFENSTATKSRSLLKRLSTTAKAIMRDACQSSVPLPHLSRVESVRALKEINEDYRANYEDETHVVLNRIDSVKFLPAVKECKIKEDLHAQINKMQNEHSWNVCRLVQAVNSLKEKEKQYMSELAVFTSKAYKQGYADGYYIALQSVNSQTNSLEPSPTVMHASLGNRVPGIVSGAEQPHNPRECFGCVPEEDQDRVLRILDSLGDDGTE